MHLKEKGGEGKVRLYSQGINNSKALSCPQGYIFTLGWLALLPSPGHSPDPGRGREGRTLDVNKLEPETGEGPLFPESSFNTFKQYMTILSRDSFEECPSCPLI